MKLVKLIASINHFNAECVIYLPFKGGEYPEIQKFRLN